MEEKHLHENIKNKYAGNPYRIPLRNNKGIIVEYALVSQEDYERVLSKKWHLSKGYANATIDRHNIRMHHFVFKKPKENHVIDHINQDKLDNQRSNLREVSYSSNANNISKKDFTTSSQYKGVRYRKNLFNARYNDIRLYSGKDERQAGIIYDVYTYQKFGEHANNNKLISYEDAMNYELDIEKQERELPKYICQTKNKKYFRARRIFREKEYIYYVKTLEEAKMKLHEINTIIHHILLMEDLLYHFQPINRNQDMIAFIPYKEHEILVSDEDWHKLSKQKWYICSNNGYAFNNDLKTMHRLILPCEDKSKVINHKNGNRIDNRRENLEIVSATENAHMRTKKSCDAKSQYFGVLYHKQLDKWQSSIKKNHKTYYLGVYQDEKEAAIAYNKKAIELYGETANLNIIL